ncbi:MAG: site-specific integrase [Clostridia bacterium]|nr:site-specific integrase [Clostridia bacterium]
MKAKKLPSGNYRVRVYDYTDENKVKHYKSFTAPTKKEAELLGIKYANYKTQMKALNTGITLGQAYDRYIDSKSNVLSENTLREYRRQREKVFQGLMNIPIDRLNQEMIQLAVNKEAKDRAPKTIKNWYSLLSVVLSVYYPDLKLNISLPQAERHEIVIPTEAEVQKLLEASKQKDSDLYACIVLGAIGCMRCSEVCALTAEDFEDNGVHVNKALAQNSEKKWVVKAPKTTDSKRFVSMPPDLIAEIRPAEGKLVNFSPDALTRRFERLCRQELGKLFRFHDLRHFAVSYIINTAPSVTQLTLMKRGGWSSSYTMNRVYTHILDEEKRKQEAEINNMFGRLVGGENK